MHIEAIAFDLDGTLLNSQSKILTSSKQAITQAKEKNIPVFLVTGRHHTAVKPYYYELALNTPIICCNGAYIYDPITDNVLSANPLSLQQARKVIQLAEEKDISLLMYSRDAMNYVTPTPHMVKFKQWVDTCPENVRPNLRQVTDFHRLLDQDCAIWKFVISHPNKDLMLDALAQLDPTEYSCEWSWVDRADIANVGNSKGGRLLELLKHYEINPQHVIAFGDNENDISMLKAVGLGVAMGNSEDKVKQCAKYVIESNEQDSIYHFLVNYIS